jgi:hypothetical protein
VNDVRDNGVRWSLSDLLVLVTGVCLFLGLAPLLGAYGPCLLTAGIIFAVGLIRARRVGTSGAGEAGVLAAIGIGAVLGEIVLQRHWVGRSKPLAAVPKEFLWCASLVVFVLFPASEGRFWRQPSFFAITVAGVLVLMPVAMLVFEGALNVRDERTRDAFFLWAGSGSVFLSSAALNQRLRAKQWLAAVPAAAFLIAGALTTVAVTWAFLFFE